MKTILFNKKFLVTVNLVLLIGICFLYVLYQRETKRNLELEDYISEGIDIVEKEDPFAVFGLEKTSPSAGYDTGLSYYPKLTWYNTLIFQKEPPRVYVDAQYPQFIGSRALGLNKYIENLVKREIENSRIRMQDLVKSAPDDLGSAILLSSSYRVLGVTNGIVSIELVFVDFTGGGNGDHSYPVTINWDLKSNRPLKNEELFCKRNYVESLVSVTRKNLLLMFFGPSAGSVDVENDAVADWIMRGTENKEGNWNNFLILDDDLFVIFPPYQVSSGASGIIRVLLSDGDVYKLICLP